MHKLHELLRRLAEADVEFVLIGGYAAVIHGSAYVTTDGIIDIITSVLGVGEFARLRERAMRADIFGVSCAVISLEDLIAAREALGREKDLLTAKELRAIAGKRRLAGE